MAGAPILLVDDSPVSLKLMRLLLTYEGFEVRTSERAEEALQMLDTFRPALVLTDIRMPGMDGVEMTRRIKRNRRTSAIRVAALTASNSALDTERALAAGCEDCIVKSEDTASLTARVRVLLGEEPPAKPASEVSERPAESQSPFSANLRRRLLEQARQRSSALLTSLDTRLDSVGTWAQLHEWAGDATLGSPTVNRLATCGEELLAESPLRVAALRECLSELYFTFEDLLAKESAPPPGYILQALRGKRVALVALPTQACDDICAALGRVEARPLLFPTAADPDWASIGDCDLIMLHVAAGMKSARLEALAESARKLLLAGECRDLLEVAAALPVAEAEFLAGNWKPEEVLMRLALAGTRSAAPRNKPAALSTPPVRARDHLSSPTVVLADDDEMILAILRTILTNHGMRCQTASNGIEAIRLIREVQPHAAVLDIDMPQANGFEVLSAIRRENLSTVVVMLSAHQQEADVLRGFRLGADDYLVKPFNPLELTARLKRLLRQGVPHGEKSTEVPSPTN
jgi:two-component system cell cycle response regulator DivK